MDNNEMANEKRKTTRHETDFQSHICALIYDCYTYPLFAPISVNVVNISKNGIRFNASCNTLFVDDKFVIQVELKGSNKLFTALVSNIINLNTNESEYGCLLIDRQKESDTDE